MVESGSIQHSDGRRFVELFQPEICQRLFFALILGLRRSEHLVKVPLHLTPVFFQCGKKAFPVIKSHGTGQAQPPQFIVWQQVCLAVLPGLNAIFHQPQKLICLGQLLHHKLRHQLLFTQVFEHRKNGAYLQLLIASSANQLKRLPDKLDLTNAAGTQLHIAIHPLTMELLTDQLLHLAQRLEGPEIEIASIDEWTQHIHQFSTGCLITGHHPRLDHGIALPLPGMTLVIGLHGIEIHRHGPGITERSQTRIHAEDKTIHRLGIQRLDQLLAEPHEKLLIGEITWPFDFPLAGIGKNQIDIRRKIELPGPELPHPQNDQILLIAFGITGNTLLRNGPFIEQIQRTGNTGIRQGRQILQRLGQRCRTGEIPPDNPHHVIPAKLPHHLVQPSLIRDLFKLLFQAI